MDAKISAVLFKLYVIELLLDKFIKLSFMLVIIQKVLLNFICKSSL